MNGETTTATDTIGILEDWNLEVKYPYKHISNNFWEKNTKGIVEVIGEWERQITDNKYVIRLEDM